MLCALYVRGKYCDGILPMTALRYRYAVLVEFEQAVLKRKAELAAACILLYINELSPGDEEMRSLKIGLDNGTTDIATTKPQDAQIIRMWRPGMDTSQLSLEFRLRRAIRVVPVSQESIKVALAEFDGVVRQSEEDIASESIGRNILEAWSPNCDDSDTCAACDFRRFCPKPAGIDSGNYRIKAPTAP